MGERTAESPGRGRPAASVDSPGLILVSGGGKAFRFDPGALCLELVATGGPGEFARFEALHTPADLVTWAGRSRLPNGLELAVTEGELAQARELRDTLFLLAADRAHGRPLQPSHLDAVNAAAVEPRWPPVSPRTAPTPGPRAPRVPTSCRRSPGTRSTCSPAPMPTVSANAARPPAVCCSSTPRARAAADGARWSTAGTGRRRGRSGRGSRPRRADLRVPSLVYALFCGGSVWRGRLRRCCPRRSSRARPSRRRPGR